MSECTNRMRMEMEMKEKVKKGKVSFGRVSERQRKKRRQGGQK